MSIKNIMYRACDKWGRFKKNKNDKVIVSNNQKNTNEIQFNTQKVCKAMSNLLDKSDQKGYVNKYHNDKEGLQCKKQQKQLWRDMITHF